MGLSKNWLVLSEPQILLQDSSQAPENINMNFYNNAIVQSSKLYDLDTFQMNLYKNITIEVFLKRSTPIGPTPYVNMEMLKMSICTMVIQYVKYGR